MVKNTRVKNKGINIILRQLINSKGLSIYGFSKVLNRSEVFTHSLLNNPYKMTFKQLIMLSGYTDTPVVEIVAKIHYNRFELSKEDKENLSSIMARVSSESKEL